MQARFLMLICRVGEEMRRIAIVVLAVITLGQIEAPVPALAGGSIAGTGLSMEDIEKISPSQSPKPLHDPQLERRALEMFPWASQAAQRAQWISDQENLQADRERGNSYSVRMR